MVDREDILRKAAALMRMTMANGCTEAEAATAAAKLQALAESYGIDLGELHEEQRRQRISDGMREARAHVPWSRLPRSIVVLENAIADGFDCRVFIVPLRIPIAGCGTEVVFVGFGPDADLAEFLFSILARELPKEGGRQGRALRLRRRRLTVFAQAFVFGAAWAIKKRLDERRRQTAVPAGNSCTAVVRISKAVVIDGYLKEKYNLHTTQRPPPRMSPTRRMGQLAGMAHGQDVPLQTALGA